jgi:hypothetical protein
MHEYRGIDIHADSQLVFWAQTVYGREDRISRIKFDGTYRTIIGNYLGPRDLDVSDNKVYWIWGSGDNISRANFDGTNPDTILTEIDAFYFVICSDLNKIYWTEYGKIRCSEIDTTDIVDLVTGLGHNIKGIALYYNPAAVSVEKQNHFAISHQLNQNYPNPFNPHTVITWQLAVGGRVELSVYNLRGQKVVTLVSKRMNPGNHSYTFDGTSLASGVYYYQLITGDFREVKKMILLR